MALPAPISYQLQQPSPTQQLLPPPTRPQTIAITVQNTLPPAALVEPHWLTYVPAVAVGLIAVAAATTVAILNWRTAHKKLQFDMFNRRLDIYQALIDAQYKFRSVRQIMDEDLLKVKKDTATAHWIFDKDKLKVVDDFLNYIKTYRQAHQQWGGWMKQNNKEKSDEAMRKREEALQNAIKVDLASAFREVLHVRVK